MEVAVLAVGSDHENNNSDNHHYHHHHRLDRGKEQDEDLATGRLEFRLLGPERQELDLSDGRRVSFCGRLQLESLRDESEAAADVLMLLPHTSTTAAAAAAVARGEQVVGGEGESVARRDTRQLSAEQLERSIDSLAHRFRCFMHFFGLLEDVSLFMVDGRRRKWRPVSRPWRNLARLLWLALALLANLLIVYVLAAHFLWELRRLDAKIAAHAKQVVGSSGQQQQSPIATANGWSILKDFLENFRRHLSRLFALATTLLWCKNCHRIELLFVDCRRYYEAFHLGRSGPPSGDLLSHGQPGDSRLLRGGGTVSGEAQTALEARRGFYELARLRINLAIGFPFAHLLANLLAIVLFPLAVIVTNNGQRSAGPSSPPAANSTTPMVPNSNLTGGGGLIGAALDNFSAFHRSIHSAFHPSEHQIGDSPSEPQVSSTESALFCLAELFVYYIYIHGPRIICATCLSLVLSLHRQCLEAFNGRLTALIRRARRRPLASSDMVRLLKAFDMIAMMHRRIEATFMWSLVLWFSLMFVSCLMQIFTLTESTSAAFQAASRELAETTSGGQPAASSAQATTSTTSTTGPATGQLAATSQLVRPPTVLASLGPICLMFNRIFFVSYAPWLVYCEAFRIERESQRAGQLIMLLARRQNDSVAQAIEPAVFETICLSVGGYFRLNKGSVSSLLGAIVTFSVMFIGEFGDQPGGRLSSATPPSLKPRKLTCRPLYLDRPWRMSIQIENNNLFTRNCGQSCAPSPS